MRERGGVTIRKGGKKDENETEKGENVLIKEQKE